MALNVQPTDAAAGAAASSTSKLIPFRWGTRQRYRPVQTVTVTPGTSVSPPIGLQQVGFLNNIDLMLQSVPGALGFTTGANAPVLAGNRRWPASLFGRLQLALNTGAATIIDVPGEQLEFINWLLQRSYNPTISTDADTYSAIYNNANTTNKVAARYRLPVAANDANDFTVGMLMLQSQQVVLNVNILWQSLGNIFSANAPTVAAGGAPNLDVHETVYAAPNPAKVALPAPSLHRIMETQYPLLNLGDNIITLPREGKLLRLYLQVVLNGAFDQNNYVDYVKVRLNDVSEPYSFTRQKLKALAIERYGMTFPPGWYVIDLWYANHQPAQGDQRDVIDTSAFSTTQLTINIDSAATLGLNAYVSVCREFLQFPTRTA